MKPSLTIKIAIVFSLLVLVVLVNFIILRNYENEVAVRHNWVLHTHEVIEESERFLGHLRDAETGQRGFLLTFDKNYLEPFHNGVTQSHSRFSSLRKLTEDNVEQQKRLDRIQDLMNRKISELEKTIHLAQQDKMVEAIEIVNSDIGKNIMDAIRERVSEFIAVEKNLLEQRNADYLRHKDTLKELFFANILLLIAFIVIACLFIQKTIARPLADISKHIIDTKNDPHRPEIKIKSSHDEIGILVSEFNKLLHNIREQSRQKDVLISELQIALDEIRTLQGIIPICSFCKGIRNDKGLWVGLEKYIQEHSDAQFSHSVCDNCLEKHYPEV